MAETHRPESPIPMAPRPGARPFMRPGSGPRPAISRPAITPSRLTRPPFRAIVPPPHPATPRDATPIAVRSTLEPIVAAPQAVLSHVAGGESAAREVESAEMALLGEDVGEALTLTPTGASDVLMAEAHGLREELVPVGAPEPAEALAPAGRDASFAEPATAAEDVAGTVAAPSHTDGDELAEQDPFALAAQAPVVESDWWSAYQEAAPTHPMDSPSEEPPQMIGGTSHAARVAASLEALANRVRSGEIQVQSVPCDAGDAAFLAGLLTSLLLSRSSA